MYDLQWEYDDWFSGKHAEQTVLTGSCDNRPTDQQSNSQPSEYKVLHRDYLPIVSGWSSLLVVTLYQGTIGYGGPPSRSNDQICWRSPEHTQHSHILSVQNAHLVSTLCLTPGIFTVCKPFKRVSVINGHSYVKTYRHGKRQHSSIKKSKTAAVKPALRSCEIPYWNTDFHKEVRSIGPRTSVTC